MMNDNVLNETNSTNRNRKKFVFPKQIQSADQSKYKVVEFLGKGGYAVVVKAERIPTDSDIINVNFEQKMVAVKAIIKKGFKPGKEIQIANYSQREIKIMLHLKHSNILKLYSHFEDSNYIYLILELCDNKTLSHIIKSDQFLLDNNKIKNLLMKIAHGCQYMHLNLVVHRDIKPDNIMLNRDFTPKIGDFGLAMLLQTPDEILHTFCGTPKYQAPEMIIGRGYGMGVDVWAMGCITYRLFYGNAPFDGTNTEDIFKATLTKRVKYLRISRFNQPIENDSIKVMKSLLEKDPEKRVKIDKLLENSKFFQNKIKLTSLEATKGLMPMEMSNNKNQSKCDLMIECLKTIAYYDKNKRIRLNYIPYHDLHLVPKHWILHWIDISLYGFGYSLKQNIFAFNFNDKSKMMRAKENVFYCDSKEFISSFQTRICPQQLAKKLAILEKAQFLLKQNQEGQMTSEDDDEQDSSVYCDLNEHDLPWIDKKVETLDALVVKLATRLIQIKFNQSGKNILLDADKNSLTVINREQKILCLNLDFLIDDHITEKMQQYVSVALQYIELLHLNDCKS